jgi:hypothetical protein
MSGRLRSYEYDELMNRDKVNLDIFWLRNQSLDESGDLPAPEILAQEIADDLQTAPLAVHLDRGEVAIVIHAIDASSP